MPTIKRKAPYDDEIVIPWGRAIPYKSPTGKETMLYSIGAVANALGRTSQTVRKWEISGVIPPTPFKLNGKRMYSKEHLMVLNYAAEKYKLIQGKQISRFFKRYVYKEFARINDEFFKEDKENDVEEE